MASSCIHLDAPPSVTTMTALPPRPVLRFVLASVVLALSLLAVAV